VIHALASPAGRCGAVIDVQPAFPMRSDEPRKVFARDVSTRQAPKWPCSTGRTALERITAALDEMPGPVVQPLDAEAAFMHRAVMKAAQGHQIGQIRRATLRPMMDVMAVHVALVRAAGENAALVA
jgi:hypothetical protein